MGELDRMSELTSRYVTSRDNFAGRYHARQSGLIGAAGSVGGPIAFDALITEHANQFARLMPSGLSLAQWEAVAELASSHLAKLRLDLVKGK